MSRPVLTAVNHYCLFPFNHGGSLGIRGLYKALSEWFDINIVTFSVPNCYPKELYINKHVKVINIVLPEKLAELQNEMYKEYGMKPDTIIDSSSTVLRYYHKFPEIVEEIKKIAEKSEIVLAEHVFTWYLIKQACPDKHLWYRANNVEYDYKIDTWGKIGSPKDLLQEVYDVERECCMNAEKILAVSSLEIDRFMSLYHIPENMRYKFMDIHSGYDIDNLDAVLPSARDKQSDNYEYMGIFVASDAPHQRQAAEHCIRIAKECPNIEIVLIGSIGKAYIDKNLPKNVLLTGVVTEEEKRRYLKSCDFALNIMEDGAGINVKMFEYFAFGIPVIATPYGARGIEVENGKTIILTDGENLIQEVKKFCEMTIEEKDKIASNALQMLKDKYSWRSIGYSIAKEIERLYHVQINQFAVPLEEIELYKITEQDVYIPKKPFYIRCAGVRGLNCYSLMKHLGMKPKAFVDENKKYVGKEIEGLPVISVSQYIKEKDGSEIIVANANNAPGITLDLIKLGVLPENISISVSNGYITNLMDKTVKTNCYYEASRMKEAILRRAKEEGVI